MTKANRAQRRKQKKKRVQPQMSFEQQLANISLKNMKPYIDEQVRGAAVAIAGRVAQQVGPLMERIVVLEDILIENVDGLTKDILAEKIALKQDSREGFEQVSEVAEGDRVRMEIQVKTGEDDYDGTDRTLIDNIGLGAVLGPEIEKEVVGMTRGETKEIAFGEEKESTAKITISMISRQPKKEEEAPKEELQDANA